MINDDKISKSRYVGIYVKQLLVELNSFNGVAKGILELELPHLNCYTNLLHKMEL